MAGRTAKKSSLIGLIVFAISAMTASLAGAEDPEKGDFVNTGGYIVLGGVTAFDNFQNTPSDFNFDTSLGFMLRGGYRIDRIFAVEAEGNFLSGWDTDNTVIAGTDATDFTLDGGVATLNALAYLPLGRFQPHVMVGLGGMWAQLRTSSPTQEICGPNEYWFCKSTYSQLGHSGSFVMKFGGGVDFYVTRDWAIVLDAEYVLPFGDLEDLRYTSFNWGFLFNF
ncbi:MAG: outer membrane beta-barrel protein [Myxococcota bacterium]|nr:outer membrane beta-barrel protein [Myxococcota bacterium]